MATPQPSPPSPLHPTTGSSNLRASSQGPDAASSSHPTSAGNSKGSTFDYPTRPRPLVTTLGWDINAIVASSPNFHHVRRVHCTSPAAKPDVAIPEFEEHGTPLIISGWNRHPRWPKSLFNIDWLKKNGDQNPTVRNVHNWSDVKMPIGDFIDKLRRIPVYASVDEEERFYGKDGECPTEWTEWLTESGAIPEQLLFDGSNDFLKFLPNEAKVQTLMCYLGIGDTFTPFHKDLCASSGQNLMCYTEHSGSAFWFMTKSSAAPRVATYFHQLGQELDLETHVVTIEELAKAPFDVFIAEQQLGDLVLVPPRSCHQVVNKGGITIKTSWSRMSLNGLHAALWHELPIYHRVCRQEIYKVKSNIFHALQHFTGVVGNLPEHAEKATRRTDTIALQRLIELFDDILASEFSISRDSMPHVSQSGSSHLDNYHCDFCGADIFQSFFECVPCRVASSAESSDSLPIGDGLVLCPSCYVEGRTCRCGVMEPVQCRPYSELLHIRDQAVRVIQRVINSYSNAYGYLSEEPGRLLSGRQTNIFEAACKLSQQRRSDSKTSRSCRARKEQAHQVPAAAAISCKPCHGSRCYTHLLEVNCIHSVDAIIRSDRYDGNTDWHLLHRHSAERYKASCQGVIEDEERGLRPDTSLRLIYLAKTFKTCRAIAPETIEHGWYDRYAQTTLIPIADTPPKTLAGLLDEFEGDELCDSPPEQHESPSSRSPITDSPVPVVVAPTFSSTVVTESIDDSNIVERPMLSRDLQSGPSASIASPSVPLELPASAPADDSGNLSDLTDLPTEANSSPRNLSMGMSGQKASNLQITNDPSFSSPFASPTPAAERSSSQSLTRPKSRSRVKFVGVEIRRPEWYNDMRPETQTPSTSQLKRKRTQTTPEVLTEDDAHTEHPPRRYPERRSASGRRGNLNPGTPRPSSPDTPGPSVPSLSSRPPPAKPIALSQFSNKGKRKMSRGAASRLPRPNEHMRTSPTILDPAPQANILASALNLTFMHNSNPGHPTGILSPNDPIPAKNTVNPPNPTPQYVDIGVQAEARHHFTKKTSTIPPPPDPFITITRLQQEKDELQSQVDFFKGRCESYREGLEEYTRSQAFQTYPPSAGGPSNFPFGFTTHAGSRVQHILTSNESQSMHVQEPDYPPIETLPLPTPSSAESPGRLLENVALPSPTRRRTPTEPRSHRKARSDGRNDHLPYRYGPRRLGRRSDSVETSKSGGKRRPKHHRGPNNPGRPLASPARLNAAVPVEVGLSNSPSVTTAEEKGEPHSTVPPSPPSTVSDQTHT